MSKIDKIVSTNLKTLRERARISQEELAEILGCEPVKVSLMEKGLSVIPPTVLYQLCFILGCKPNELFPPLQYVKRSTRKGELRMALKELIKKLMV